jgi:hypothetical protein
MICASEGMRQLRHRISRRVPRMREGDASGKDDRENLRDGLAQLDLHGAQARQQGQNVKRWRASWREESPPQPIGKSGVSPAA